MNTTALLTLIGLALLSEALVIPTRYRHAGQPDPGLPAPPPSAATIWDTSHGRRTLKIRLALDIAYPLAAAAAVLALVWALGAEPPFARTGAGWRISPEYQELSDRAAAISPLLMILTVAAAAIGASWIASRLRERASWFTHPNAPAGAPRWWRALRAGGPAAICGALLITLVVLNTPTSLAAAVAMALVSTIGIAVPTLFQRHGSPIVPLGRLVIAVAAGAVAIAGVEPVWGSLVVFVIWMSVFAGVAAACVANRFELDAMAKTLMSTLRLRSPSRTTRQA